MLTYWQSHQEYLDFLHEAKIHFDSSQRLRLHTELAVAREKLRLLDLDSVMDYMASFYPRIGRPAQNQPQIIRSFALFFLFSGKAVCTGLTAWVARLKHDPLLASLIGCTTDSLPPLGSYFDLMDRIWGAMDKDSYARHKLFPPDRNRSKPKKPTAKGQKAQEPQKKITEKIVSHLEQHRDVPFNFEAPLQNILLLAAVRPSIRRGLIPPEGITISGDGTCIHTHAAPQGKRQHCRFASSCHSHALCFRHYSDPDAHWGWDSDLNCYFFGYMLYTLCVHDDRYQVDLPVLARFTSAARHDSVIGLVALHEFKKHAADIPLRNVCLDSAHDNYPTYRLIGGWHSRPFIDLNSHRGRPRSIPDHITIDKDGTPLCSAGFRMVSWGYDPSKHAVKWRCPSAVGKIEACSCICSESPYGRTVHAKPSWDIRLYTPVPRGTPEYKRIYNNRTSCERINNRILNDYGLHSMRIHTKKHYSFMTMIICICIHLDAWYKQQRCMQAA